MREASHGFSQFKNMVIQSGLRLRSWEGAKVKREVSKTVYAFYDTDAPRTEKDKVRFLTIGFIERYFVSNKVKKVRALTLPGMNWPFEKELSKRLGANHGITTHYVSCERDYEVFKLAAAKMPCHTEKGVLKIKYCHEVDCEMVNNGRHILLFYSDIFKFIRLEEREQKRMFNLIWFDSTSLITSFSHNLHLLAERLTENGILVITCLNGREHMQFEDRAQYITDIISSYGLSLKKKITYFDTVSMLHLIYSKDCNQ